MDYQKGIKSALRRGTFTVRSTTSDMESGEIRCQKTIHQISKDLKAWTCSMKLDLHLLALCYWGIKDGSPESLHTYLSVNTRNTSQEPEPVSHMVTKDIYFVEFKINTNLDVLIQHYKTFVPRNIVNNKIKIVRKNSAGTFNTSRPLWLAARTHLFLLCGHFISWAATRSTVWCKHWFNYEVGVLAGMSLSHALCRLCLKLTDLWRCSLPAVV